MILSRLIRWGYKEDCSHFAICFDDFLVFHSNLVGVHMTTLDEFQQSATVVHEIDIPLTLESEEKIYKDIIPRFNKKKYDFGAFLYLAYRLVLLRLFGKPLPVSNPWGDKDKFICTEMVTVLPSYLTGVTAADQIDSMSPHTLYTTIMLRLSDKT